MIKKDLQNLISKINEDFKKHNMDFLIVNSIFKDGFIKFLCAIEVNYNKNCILFREIEIKKQYIKLNYNLLFELITLKLKKKQYQIIKYLEVKNDKNRTRI